MGAARLELIHDPVSHPRNHAAKTSMTAESRAKGQRYQFGRFHAIRLDCQPAQKAVDTELFDQRAENGIICYLLPR
jgi:hypothetical protein